MEAKRENLLVQSTAARAEHWPLDAARFFEAGARMAEEEDKQHVILVNDLSAIAVALARKAGSPKEVVEFLRMKLEHEHPFDNLGIDPAIETRALTNLQVLTAMRGVLGRTDTQVGTATDFLRQHPVLLDCIIRILSAIYSTDHYNRPLDYSRVRKACREDTDEGGPSAVAGVAEWRTPLELAIATLPPSRKHKNGNRKLAVPTADDTENTASHESLITTQNSRESVYGACEGALAAALALSGNEYLSYRGTDIIDAMRRLVKFIVYFFTQIENREAVRAIRDGFRLDGRLDGLSFGLVSSKLGISDPHVLDVWPPKPDQEFTKLPLLIDRRDQYIDSFLPPRVRDVKRLIEDRPGAGIQGSRALAVSINSLPLARIIELNSGEVLNALEQLLNRRDLDVDILKAWAENVENYWRGQDSTTRFDKGALLDILTPGGSLTTWAGILNLFASDIMKGLVELRSSDHSDRMQSPPGVEAVGRVETPPISVAAVVREPAERAVDAVDEIEEKKVLGTTEGPLAEAAATKLLPEAAVVNGADKTDVEIKTK